MYTDRIDLSIPQADIESVLTDIASAAATLEFLPLFSPSERKHLAKLGLKNEGLARRIIELGRANPGVIPRDIDFEKVDRDLLTRDQLWNLKLVLERLLGRVDGALMLTGVDLYAAALEMYHCLRRNADRAGIRDVIDEIKKGFARPSRKKKQETQPAATPAVVMTSSPEPVAQVPDPDPVAPESAPARTALAVLPNAAAESVPEPVPERRIQPLALSPGRSQPGAAPLLHSSTQPLPHIFSGGFASAASVYVHRELPQHDSRGLTDAHWPNNLSTSSIITESER